MFVTSLNPVFGIRYEEKAGQVFYALCGFAVASLLINFQFSYLIFGLIYVEQFAHRMFSRQKHQSPWYPITFVFFLSLGAFYWWHHGSNVSTAEFLRTIELVLIFCALVMVADATKYNLNRFDPNIGLMGAFGLISVPLFAAIKIAYELIFLNFSEMVKYGGHADVLFQSIFRGRSNLLVWINPNHADDVFLLLALASLMFGTFVAIYHRKWKSALVVFATVVFLVFLSLFFATKAVGGYVGLGVGLLLLSIMIVWRVAPKWRIEIIVSFCALIAVSAFVVGFVNVDKINTAITNDSGKICSQAYNDIKRDTLWMKFKKKARVRLVLWSNAVKVWKEKPVFGHGHYDTKVLTSSFPHLEPCLFQKFAHSHSAYMDILIRGGVALLTVYLLTIFVVGRQLIVGFATSRSWLSYVFAGIAVYFTYLVVENIFDLTFVVSSYLKASLLNYTMLVTVAFFLLKKPELRSET